MQENNWDKPEGKKEKIKSLLTVTIYMLFGGVVGSIVSAYFENFVDSYTKSDNTFGIFLESFAVIATLILSFFIHLIIHEAGHLIFGLLTGYSFLSFRIGSYIVVKEEEKLVIKRYKLPGIAGQCLMIPPDTKNGKSPFALYNYGGVILNLTASIIGIMIGVNLNYPLKSILVAFSMAGFFMTLTNGIPIIIGGVPNDAHNILSIIKDKGAKESFFIQLKVHALQSQGLRLKDMPIETFKLEEDADLSKPLNTALRLIEYNWYLDNLDLENAKKAINSFKPYFKKIAASYKYEINCERIFLELVGDCDRKLIDDLYDKNLKKYIKAARLMIGKKRLLMAYEAFYNNNKEKALEYYEELKASAREYPVKGEAEMELMLANWIAERL